MCRELTAHPKWPNGFRLGRHRLDGYVRIETRVSHGSHRHSWQPSRTTLLHRGFTVTEVVDDPCAFRAESCAACGAVKWRRREPLLRRADAGVRHMPRDSRPAATGEFIGKLSR